jgi:arylsulfatase
MARQLSRRSFVRVAGLGAGALAFVPNLRGQAAKLPRKPNLLVILPDQFRRGSLACYGAPKVHAPNLNKLASASAVFEHAYVTHPICVPSRSSLMTGTWPHANGCTRNKSILDPRFLCLPEMIADSDYRTGYMGKWHLGDEVFPQHGFEEWISTEDSYAKKLTANHQDAKETMTDYNKFLISKGLKPDGKDGSFGQRMTTTLPIELRKPKFLETHACDFIARHERDPFILFVAFFEPHPPYSGPLNNEHAIEEIDIEPSATQVMGEDMPLRYRLREEHFRKSFGTTPDDYRKTKQKYLGLITEVDSSIGAILGQLERSGLSDDTIVVFSSDHGDMMGAHRLFGKGVMFDEAAGVPYIVRLPGQRSAIRVRQRVSQIDFAPTMLDLLGKPANQQCAGRSRAALVKGEQMAPENIFFQWSPGMGGSKKMKRGTKLATPEQIKEVLNESTRAIISPEDWKLCRRDKDKNELYNLRDDPGEQHNLFYDGKHEDVVTKLTGEIHRWQEKTGDTVKL